MNILNILILGLLLQSCAHTDFYHDGKKIAHFEGDMKGMRLKISEKGAIDWSGDVDHSNATLAQGKAASDKIQATGLAVAASGIVSLLK